MLSLDPKELPVPKLHGYMLSAIAPRPICFASTVDKDGQVNRRPYSFFNAFGSNPTTLIFSPARRVRDNTTKHTLQNVMETMEVCINVVSHDMVEQMSLSSTEYDKGVNEFVKAGFTELPSEVIKAPRVKESPVQFECKVREVIETGTEGGAGNLIVCEIVKMHINEDVLDDEGKIDQHKIKLVGRLGKDWYVSAFGDALFEIEKPLRTKGIGVDSIPEPIRNSQVLTGNNLGRLGNVEGLPSAEEVSRFKEDPVMQNLEKRFAHHAESYEYESHALAKKLIDAGDVQKAWLVLFASIK